MAADLRSAMAPVSALGGFFPVEIDPGPSADWLPFSALLEPASDLRSELVDGVRRTLAARGAEVEDRVAASLWLLGWSARLVAPWLGAAVLSAVVPLAGPRDVLWRKAIGQPVPIALKPTVSLAIATPEAMYDEGIRSLVEPLVEVVAAAHHVSPQVLWGNVASTVAGTGALLPGASALVDAVLAQGQLAGRGAFPAGRFRRRSCCLLYRVAGSGVCGDCVLA